MIKNLRQSNFRQQFGQFITSNVGVIRVNTFGNCVAGLYGLVDFNWGCLADGRAYINKSFKQHFKKVERKLQINILIIEFYRFVGSGVNCL